MKQDLLLKGSRTTILGKTVAVQHEEAMLVQQDGTLAPLREVVVNALIDKAKDKDYAKFRNPNFNEEGAGSYKAPKIKYPGSQTKTNALIDPSAANFGEVTLKINVHLQTNPTLVNMTDLKRYAEQGTLVSKLMLAHQNQMDLDLIGEFYNTPLAASINEAIYLGKDIEDVTPEEADAAFILQAKGLNKLGTVSPYVKPGFDDENLIAIMTKDYANKLGDISLNKGAGSESQFKILENGTSIMRMHRGIEIKIIKTWDSEVLNPIEMIMMPRDQVGFIEEIIGLDIEKMQGHMTQHRIWAEYDLGSVNVWPEFVFTLKSGVAPLPKGSTKFVEFSKKLLETKNSKNEKIALLQKATVLENNLKVAEYYRLESQSGEVSKQAAEALIKASQKYEEKFAKQIAKLEAKAFKVAIKEADKKEVKNSEYDILSQDELILKAVELELPEDNAMKASKKDLIKYIVSKTSTNK